ncbi:MAG: hypothetical protein ACYS6K_16830 [Planctomycetota bacterium]
MAYVEVWKSGRLIPRRRVDERKALKGCKIRLGSIGEALFSLDHRPSRHRFAK